MPKKTKINKWDKHNSLTVVKEVLGFPRKSWYIIRRVRCVCDCWKEHEVALSHLRNGSVKSCGCKAGWKVKHWHNYRGGTTKEYRTFMSMKNRCKNIKDKRYKQYWGRWIRLEWDNFEDFYRDMWDAPTPYHSIDRIDNNWHYCKENCRRASVTQQARNKRSNVILEYGWIRWTADYICESMKIPLRWKIVLQRIRRNWWSVEKAFTT